MKGVALVDDHVLLRNGLANLIESFGEYKVLFEADNGRDFTERLDPKKLPDIVLLDINMPGMDGYQTCVWLKKNYPGIKVLALSMYDNENAVIRMFKAGAKGYILKDCDPPELKNALERLVSKGFYYSEMVTGKIIQSINTIEDNGTELDSVIALNEREMTFLRLAATELTYKEIADKMKVSPRTVDNYRDSLCRKLNVRSRIGLVMYGIRSGLVHI